MASSSLLRAVIDLGLGVDVLNSRFLNAVSTSDFVASRRTRDVTSFLVDPIRRNVKCNGVAGGSIFVLHVHDSQALLKNRFVRWYARETVRYGATKRGRVEIWDFSSSSSRLSVYFSSSWEFVLVKVVLVQVLLVIPDIIVTTFGASVGIIGSDVPVKTVLSIATASFSIYSRKGKKESTMESRISWAIQSVCRNHQ